MFVHQAITVLLFISCFIFRIKTDEIPEVQCVSSPLAEKSCSITINLTSDDGRMTISGDQSVTSVFFKDSIVNTISSDICDTFRHIIQLEIKTAQVKNIVKGAFKNCKEMKLLYMPNNNLHDTLDENLFRTNVKLNFINFQSNALSYWHPKSFDKLRLKQLWLAHNQMNDFPITLIMRSKNTLNTLYIDNNKLTDLDAERLVENFPKLLRVHFHSNSIPKARRIQINKIFVKAGIETDG